MGRASISSQTNPSGLTKPSRRSSAAAFYAAYSPLAKTENTLYTRIPISSPGLEKEDFTSTNGGPASSRKESRAGRIRWALGLLLLGSIFGLTISQVTIGTDSFPALAGLANSLPSGLLRSSSFASSPINPSEHALLLATSALWHSDIWLSVGAMFQNDLGIETELYVDCPEVKAGDHRSCVSNELMTFAATEGVWRKPTLPQEDFIDAVNTPMADGRLANIIFLPTAAMDMPAYSTALLAKWQERPEDQKFKLLVIYHHPSDWLDELINPWSDLGVLHLFTISEHVRVDLKKSLSFRAAHESQADFGLEDIPIDVIIPFLPLQESMLQHAIARYKTYLTSKRSIDRAVILGAMRRERRQYGTVFEDFEKALKSDAKSWGYRLDETLDPPAYVELEKVEGGKQIEPFKLVFAGQLEGVWEENMFKIPEILRFTVVEVYDPSEEAQQQVLATVDLILPAFNPDYHYLENQASGSMLKSIQSGIPALLTPSIVNLYTFLEPSYNIVRPAALSEMDTIWLFRHFAHMDQVEGNDAWSSIEDGEMERELLKIWPKAQKGSKRMRKEVEKMLRRGWARDPKQWQKHIDKLGRQNEKALRSAILS